MVFLMCWRRSRQHMRKKKYVEAHEEAKPLSHYDGRGVGVRAPLRLGLLYPSLDTLNRGVYVCLNLGQQTRRLSGLVTPEWANQVVPGL